MGIGFWETVILAPFCIGGLLGLAGFGYMIYIRITEKKQDDSHDE